MTPRSRRFAVLAAIAFAGLLLALRLAAISRETIHWDEWSLLDRAQRSLRTGEILGGGRPGLAVLALMPAVAGCTDEIAVVRRLRWVWTGIALLLLGGLFALIREASPGPGAGGRAALGVALLALVPIFLRWSLQIRTDQPALAAALWGGVAILASRRRPALALAAGGLVGVGFLFSQKALYAAALAGLLVLAEPWLGHEPRRWRREVGRAGLAALGAVAAIGLYLGLVALRFPLPDPFRVQADLATFAYYRTFVGLDAFARFSETFLPHLALAGAFGIVSVAVLTRRSPERGDLLTGWAILGLGAAVYAFHAGRFPYFWMTAGLFPGVALALAQRPVAAVLGVRRSRGLIAGVWAVLGVQSLFASFHLLDDSQGVQVRTLAFVNRNFGRESPGFQAEKALFCRADPEPMPLLLGVHVHRRFGGAGSAGEIEAFLERWRRHPPHFVVRSHRLASFPPEIRDFIDRHYRLYFEQAMLPAMDLTGSAGFRQTFDVLVAGPYRWLPGHGQARGSLSIDGVAIEAGARIDLTAGRHDAEFDAAGGGTLWWSIEEPMAPGGEPFYGDALLGET